MSSVFKEFAIIGQGFIYNQHEEAIAKIGGEIVDIIDESGGPDAWREMIKRTEAECIVILAPNHLHFEMAKFSAENRRAVLCEKPLALKSEEAKILVQYANIFTVYQLRYHPAVKKLKSEFKENENYRIEMDISVHRDEDYWQSWKGKEERSGGILFNLGIHYFDLLIYLFGEPTEVLTKSLSYKAGQGKISGKNYFCDWQIRADVEKENQKRVFKINGTDYNFSSKDNLSFENLHVFVYEDLIKKQGVLPKESLKSVELIEKIYANAK